MYNDKSLVIEGTYLRLKQAWTRRSNICMHMPLAFWHMHEHVLTKLGLGWAPKVNPSQDLPWTPFSSSSMTSIQVWFHMIPHMAGWYGDRLYISPLSLIMFLAATVLHHIKYLSYLFNRTQQHYLKCFLNALWKLNSTLFKKYEQGNGMKHLRVDSVLTESMTS